MPPIAKRELILHNKGNTTLEAGAVNKVLATQKCYDNESD
jgi:hypothetical protein